MFSNQKLIIAGNFYHHYLYNQLIKYDYEKPKIQKIYSQQKVCTDQPRQEPFQSNYYRTKKAIKLLLQANIQTYPSTSLPLPQTQFITYTFAKSITDFQQANRLYSKFTQRFNYQLFRTKKVILQYLTVPEIQEKRRARTGKAVIHYHTIYFNLPFIKQSYDTISKLWKQGFINQQTIQGEIQNLTGYLTKYITKQGHIPNSKSYFTSNNLVRPTLYRNTDTINNLLPTNHKPIFTKTFKRPETNLITQYALYNKI
jgi:hypothetical protein